MIQCVLTESGLAGQENIQPIKQFLPSQRMMFSESFLFGRHFTHPFVRNRNKICILRGRQEFYWRTIRTLKKNKHQNPVVQRVDNAIQRMNHYPADIC